MCSVISVDTKKGLLHLGGVDLVDGTPVLDIKPYVPYDSIPCCKVPGWVMPPVEGDVTSGKAVAFSSEAEAQLFTFFCEKSSGAEVRDRTSLRHFEGRRSVFEACVREVIAQDPRSLLKKADSKPCPFNLTIDGMNITFEARDDKMLVTSVTVDNGAFSGAVSKDGD